MSLCQISDDRQIKAILKLQKVTTVESGRAKSIELSSTPVEPLLFAVVHILCLLKVK
jgi:hypothetical protein